MFTFFFSELWKYIINLINMYVNGKMPFNILTISFPEWDLKKSIFCPIFAVSCKIRGWCGMVSATFWCNQKRKNRIRILQFNGHLLSPIFINLELKIKNIRQKSNSERKMKLPVQRTGWLVMNLNNARTIFSEIG